MTPQRLLSSPKTTTRAAWWYAAMLWCALCSCGLLLESCKIKGFECRKDKDCKELEKVCIEGWCEDKVEPLGTPPIKLLPPEFSCPPLDQRSLSKPILMAQHQTYVTHLSSDGKNLYWLNRKQDRIYYQPVGAGEPKPWYTGPDTLYNITVGDKYIYAGLRSSAQDPPDGSIIRLSKPGTNRVGEGFVVRNIDTPNSLHLGAQFVYWNSINSSLFGGHIMKARKQISSKAELITQSNNPIALALDDTHLYWITNTSPGEIRSYNLRKEEVSPTPRISDIEYGVDLVLGHTNIYYLDDETLRLFPKEGGLSKQIYNKSGEQLLLDTYYIYLIRKSKLYQFALHCETKPEPIVEDAFPGEVESVSQDERNLYLLVRSHGENQIYKMKKLYIPTKP